MNWSPIFFLICSDFGLYHPLRKNITIAIFNIESLTHFYWSVKYGGWILFCFVFCLQLYKYSHKTSDYFSNHYQGMDTVTDTDIFFISWELLRKTLEVRWNLNEMMWAINPLFFLDRHGWSGLTVTLCPQCDKIQSDIMEIVNTPHYYTFSSTTMAL